MLFMYGARPHHVHTQSMTKTSRLVHRIIDYNHGRDVPVYCKIYKHTGRLGPGQPSKLDGVMASFCEIPPELAFKG